MPPRIWPGRPQAFQILLLPRSGLYVSPKYTADSCSLPRCLSRRQWHRSLKPTAISLSSSASFSSLASPTTTTKSTSTHTLSPTGPRALFPSTTPASAFRLVLASSRTAALERKIQLPVRTGILARKKGMTALYDVATGKRMAATVVQLDRLEVVATKTMDKHGYYAVQVGSGFRHPKNVSRAMKGHFCVAQVAPKEKVVEFMVKGEAGLLPVGMEIGPGFFREGMFVDVKAVSKGKGFSGVMKRHGMHGQDRSHGVSLTHRSMGSAGQSQGGGSRVYPGKRMAGRMGAESVTTQNVKVLKVDEELGILVLNGCFAGPNGSIIKIRDALKKPPTREQLASTAIPPGTVERAAEAA